MSPTRNDSARSQPTERLAEPFAETGAPFGAVPLISPTPPLPEWIGS